MNNQPKSYREYKLMANVRRLAKETGAEILPDGLRWPGPPEATQDSLTIPFDDLGRGEDGGIFRVSLCPHKTNILLEGV